MQRDEARNTVLSVLNPCNKSEEAAEKERLDSSRKRRETQQKARERERKNTENERE